MRRGRHCRKREVSQLLLLGQERDNRLAEHLARAILKDLLRTAIPGGNPARGVQQKDGILMYTFYQQAIIFLTLPQRFCGPLTFCNIDKGEHDAVDLVLDRAIRPQAHEVTMGVFRPDFAFNWNKIL